MDFIKYSDKIFNLTFFILMNDYEKTHSKILSEIEAEDILTKKNIISQKIDEQSKS